MQQTVTAIPASTDPALTLGRFTLCVTSLGDADAALDLRALCFRSGKDDRDALDPLCRHVTVTEQGGQTVAAFRLMVLAGQDIATSYSAGFYDLTPLTRAFDRILELGRFCLHPDWHDPDILRLSWAALTRIVDAQGIGLMCGCSSFAGTDPTPHHEALSLLAARHLAPPNLSPPHLSPPRLSQQRKGAVIDYPALCGTTPPDPVRALGAMPPLLRTYLGMGGWVSDHAVIDRDLDTLHVFTGVEIARIPPARARILRALAARA